MYKYLCGYLEILAAGGGGMKPRDSRFSWSSKGMGPPQLSPSQGARQFRSQLCTVKSLVSVLSVFVKSRTRQQCQRMGDYLVLSCGVLLLLANIYLCTNNASCQIRGYKYIYIHIMWCSTTLPFSMWSCFSGNKSDRNIPMQVLKPGFSLPLHFLHKRCRVVKYLPISDSDNLPIWNLQIKFRK